MSDLMEAIKRTGNPYAKLSSMDDDEPAERSERLHVLIRRSENPYFSLSLSDDPEGDSAARQEVFSTSGPQPATPNPAELFALPGHRRFEVSKSDFEAGCRPIFFQYEPLQGSGQRLRPEFRRFIAANRDKRPESSAEDFDRSKWTVLVDSERFAVTQGQLECEEDKTPLPDRVRNTVAHELLHSLTFHTNDRGYDFQIFRRKGEKRQSFIDRTERETEKLSPLLLIPQKAIAEMAAKPNLSIHDFADLRSRCAVSRDLVINRMKLLLDFDDDGLRRGTSLENIALGTGEWFSAQQAQLRGWPLFSNFESNRQPYFIEELSTLRSLPISKVSGDLNFILNGGDSQVIEFEGRPKTEVLDYLKMRAEMHVEDSAQKRKGRFLFMVKKLRGN